MSYIYRKLLHVEDQEIIRELVRCIFEGSDIVLHSAVSLKECVDEIKNFIPDVVLLDSELKGYKGIDIAHKIYEINSDIPIIFVSGLDESLILSNGKPKNVLGVINKPFSPEDFPTRIQNLLANHVLLDNIRAKMPKKISALVMKYQKHLVSKRYELIDLWHEVEKDSLNIVLIDRLLIEFHNICGTAGMYGMHSVSESAEKLELLFRDFKGRKGYSVEDLINDGESMFKKLVAEIEALQ
ncbi:response regulator [Zooshikella marina]|uniref:response regulator n=1 Tax=Zooshikella ganghwensis TaxID=202772 RepID=UPI001BAE5F87|nr:response regulator [Zooshikella ganghwensis]MBU2708213.1 response regulator [Zooshikella ganghwensis]